MAGLRQVLVLILLAAAGPVSAPVAADWLVLSEGGAIETQGPWEVKGKLIVFHRANGKLASMRLSEVDIEQSHRRTVVAKAPKPEPVVEPRKEVKAVLVLTDADVAHVDPSDFLPATERDADDEIEGDESEDADEGAGESTPKDGRAPSEGAVEVTGWHSVSDMEFPGSKIGGAVRNDSEHPALNIVLTARLTDDNGRVVGRAQATLGQKGLQPGASTSFRAEFSGVYSYSGIDFEVQSFDAVRRGD